MSLSLEEIQNIEEEELLRFKTRKTLEISEEYRFSPFNTTYRSRAVALYIRCFACGMWCAVALIIVFPETVLSWLFPAIAAFFWGFVLCYLFTWRKKVEHAIWGAPLEVASRAEIRWDTILFSLTFLLGPILWVRGRGYDSFLTVFVVLCAINSLFNMVWLLNIRGPRDRKEAATIRPLEEVFAESLKRRTALPPIRMRP